MKKILLIFIAIIINNELIYSQVFDYQIEGNLEMKYWSYRYRLLGDNFDHNKYPGFVALGGGAGYNIPADSRNLNTNCTDHGDFWWDPTKYDNYPGCANQSFCDIITLDNDLTPLQGEMKWSDNPLVNMGMYLGVLATEWDLLSYSNINGSRQNELDETQSELYNALETVNRLDRYSESVYGLPQMDPDGLFARSDIPEDFAFDHFGSNYDLTHSETSCCSYGLVHNGLEGCPADNNKPGEEWQRNIMSSDEALGLLTGLRLVQACIPSWVQSNGTYLSIEAMNIAKRLMEHMKDSEHGGDWQIRDPLGNLVCRGANLIGFSFPIAKTYHRMTGDNFQNWLSLTTGWQAWQADESLNMDFGSLRMTLELAAISSTWSDNNMDNRAYEYNLPIYSLISCFLDNRQPTVFNAYLSWLYTLNAGNTLSFGPLPCGNGKSGSTEDGPYEPQWFPGALYEGNGMAYMLAFNLFQLVFHSDYPRYYLGNLVNRTISDVTFPNNYTDFNGGTVSWGSNDHPIVLRALDSWVLGDGIIMNEHANVTFVAQNEISPPDGANVDVSNIGDGFVDFIPADFECTCNYYDLGNGAILLSAKESNQNSFEYSSGSINQSNYVKVKSDAQLLNLYPNPADDFVTLSIADKEIYSVNFLDSYARIIQTSIIDGQLIKIDISNIVAGFYWVYVLDRNGQIIGRAKLVVN